MNKTSPTFIFLLLCVFVISACTPSSGSSDTPVRDANQPILNRDAAGSYSAEFHMEFAGAKNWTYQLKTRKSMTLREISLHIEGVKAAQNPGDIRMVSDNTITRMIGPGTDNECVQFPNGQGMDPDFIYPESLISLKEMGNAFKLQGEEQLGEMKVLHFRATGASSGPWKNANIDIWQEVGSGMLRQLTMDATGEDPFFQGGTGKLTAGYIAPPLGSEPINPVEGCEIDVSLPENISMFVRLPGLASFESNSSVEDLITFFQTTLPGQNWVEKEPPAQVSGNTVLSYQRDAESVEIHIEENPAGGRKVKLLFIE